MGEQADRTRCFAATMRSSSVVPRFQGSVQARRAITRKHGKTLFCCPPPQNAPWAKLQRSPKRQSPCIHLDDQESMHALSFRDFNQGRRGGLLGLTRWPRPCHLQAQGKGPPSKCTLRHMSLCTSVACSSSEGRIAPIAQLRLCILRGASETSTAGPKGRRITWECTVHPRQSY